MLAILLLFFGCSLSEPGPCEKPEGSFCLDCLDGYWTCTYEGYEATSGDCGGPCHTKWDLFDEACDQGLTPTWEEFEAAVECVEAEGDTGEE